MSAEVVFDGYPLEPSTKDHEHLRRTSKSCKIGLQRQVDVNTKQIGNQESFLGSTVNKRAFIALLENHLQLNGFVVHQAHSDADIMITSVAVNCARHCDVPVTVLAEDTDVLVLLLYHRQPNTTDIYFVSESKKGRGGKMIGGKCINVSAVQSRLGLMQVSAFLLFMH